MAYTKPTKSQKQPSPDWAGFVGKFFHRLAEDGSAERQGRILGQPASDIFFVLYFEWLTGSPNTVELVKLSQFLSGKYVFYSSDEVMREAYEYLLPRKREPVKPKAGW